MSGRSGISPDVLPLPSGAGAIKGLGERFAPDLHTGTGKYSVPLAVPEGRNGLRPSIDLTYSSGFASGPFGVGWRIAIPHIARSGARGLPRHDDDDDFVLDGARLVEVARDAGAIDYRTQPAAAPVRIRKLLDGGPGRWEVRTPDGLVHEYATAVADPERPERVARWWLTRTTDTFGNRIDYLYARDSGDRARRWDQVYPDVIRYADLIEVRFHWDDRPDPSSDWRAGFEIRTTRRCARIEVWTRSDQDRLVRTYELRYVDQLEADAARRPVNGCSLLAEIGLTGHDGTEVEALPPLRLAYAPWEPAARRAVPLAFDGAAAAIGETCELVDLFGRGLPDLVELGDVARYWKNAGGGRYEVPRTLDAAPAGVRLTDPGVRLLDADGDGRVELAVSDPQPGWYPAGEGGWDAAGFRPSTPAPAFGLADPDVALLDLDGDGAVDALRAGARLECFFSDRRDGWNRVRVIERGDLDVAFSDPRVHLADMTGDGLLDIVSIHGRSVRYWPNRGHGDFGPAMEMAGAPALSPEVPPERILLGDVDGDGVADLVLLESGQVTIWINRGGNAWSEPVVIAGTPARGDARLADISGSGNAGILWSDADGVAQAFFLDLIGPGTRPYLLVGIDARQGATTRIEYRSSTRYWLDDARDPRTRWRTALPFPVQVVARVETLDAISRTKLTSEYRYHHGLWDGRRRELCGFGRVDQLDTQDVYDFNDPAAAAVDPVPRTEFSAAMETRTWFHHGVLIADRGGWSEPDFSDEYWEGDAAWGEVASLAAAPSAGLDPLERRDALHALRGRPLRTEVYERDGSAHDPRPLTVVEYGHAVRLEARAANGEPLAFPHLAAERATRWDRGDEPMTRLRVLRHDALGQRKDELEIAVPRGRDPRAHAPAGEPYLASRRTWTTATRDDGTLFALRLAVETDVEVDNDGSMTLAELVADVHAGRTTERVVGQRLHHYDGDAFEGLPLGELGRFGALVRVEELVLTDALVRDAYGGDAGLFLGVDGAVPGAEYPADFLDRLLPRAGYLRHPGSGQIVAGLFSPIVRNRYDFHDGGGTARGLLMARRDPLGHDVTFRYDELALLPVAAVDASGLETQVVHDRRLLRASMMIDANGNRTRYRYTPLGMISSVAVLGQPGEPGLDRDDDPSLRFFYDAWAHVDRGEPVSVRTVRRVHHADGSELIESVQFSDGFRRQVQTRTRAEAVSFDGAALGLPADADGVVGDATGTVAGDGEVRVVVNGWRRYDNKGRVIAEWEPFFATGWGFTPAREAARGLQLQARFDALGRPVRAINADGSEERQIHGVPADLDDPHTYRPTPWETFTYDVNDNAGRTHPIAAADYRHHWNTPGSVVRDGLGRVVASVSRTRDRAPDGTWSGRREQVTRFTYDLRGNRRSVIDAAGRTVVEHVHDLRRPDDDRGADLLAVRHLDGGVRRFVFDAAGNELERRDGKGALTLRGHDGGGRPVRMWARDRSGEAVTLRMRVSFGDADDAGLTPAEARAGNWLGCPHTIHDESGRTTLGPYDAKGNLLRRSRRLLADDVVLGTGDRPARTDWEPGAGGSLAALEAATLEPDELIVEWEYDALNRTAAKRYPEDVSGTRRRTTLVYNQAGLLDGVAVGDQHVVERLAYDPRGRCVLAAFGNGLLSRLAYHPEHHGLARLRTERCTPLGDDGYRPAGGVLQDLAFAPDLAGNIRVIRDRGPGRGIPGSPEGMGELRRTFEHDPLYQLVSATGRRTLAVGGAAPWADVATGGDPDASCGYVETYAHDLTGNLTSLHHASPATTYTRAFTLAPGGNRLAATDVAYAYDDNGNLVGEGTARSFAWDHADRLIAARTEPAITIFLHASDGTRLKRISRRADGVVESAIYLDGDFERHRRRTAAGAVTRDVLHAVAGDLPVASFEVTAGGVARPRYYLVDQVANVEVVADADGALLHREELSPFGENMFGAAPGQRFRFAGKERDPAAGIYFHGARCYLPWLGRWASVDPLLVAARDDASARLSQGELVNGYGYARNNPVRYNDRTGLSVGTGIYNFFLLLIRVASNVLSIAAIAAMYKGTMTAKSEKSFGAGVCAGRDQFRETLRWQFTKPLGITVSIAAGALGLVHGIRMWVAGTHNGAEGFFGFLLDNTWGAPNSLVGSLFATITVGKSIDKTASEGTGRLLMTNGFSPSYATTFGNVTAGLNVQRHENQHVWQARIFGFYYYPIYAFNYAINLIPYWLLFQSSLYPNDPIDSFEHYFTKGVYPCTLFEMWAYGVQGDPP